MKRIVFLDIDGVLNSVRYDRRRTERDGNIDESRLALLKSLIDETKAEIVLSSSWRKHWSQTESECDPIGAELNDTFHRNGLTISDKTPLLPALHRSSEIRMWLSEHSDQVMSFVIFDDIFSGWGDLEAYHVRTDSRIGYGLEESHLQQAKQILEGRVGNE